MLRTASVIDWAQTSESAEYPNQITRKSRYERICRSGTKALPLDVSILIEKRTIRTRRNILKGKKVILKGKKVDGSNTITNSVGPKKPVANANQQQSRWRAKNGVFEFPRNQTNRGTIAPARASTGSEIPGCDINNPASNPPRITDMAIGTTDSV